eukprot:1611459-Pleurochrysis_carterae.AAC.3
MRLGISSRTVCCTLVSSDERRSNFPPELCRPDPETCFSDGERAEGCLPSSGWSEALLEALRERVSDTRTAVGDAGLEHLLTMLGKQRRSSSSSAQPGKWRSRSHARDCCAARLPSSVSCSADRPMPEANDVLASEGRADRTWLGLPSLGGGCFGRDERRVDSCNCGCEPVLESERRAAVAKGREALGERADGVLPLRRAAFEAERAPQLAARTRVGYLELSPQIVEEDSALHEIVAPSVVVVMVDQNGDDRHAMLGGHVHLPTSERGGRLEGCT